VAVPSPHHLSTECGAKTILVVEDDEDHVELIVQAINALPGKIKINVVRSGASAIDYLFSLGEFSGRKGSEVPDLILLDLKLPRMDGKQVLQVLRNVRHSEKVALPPIVVLTSSENDDDIREAYRLGAHSYLVKPIDFESFNDSIRTAVTYWLDLNTPGKREQLFSHQISFPH